MMRQGLRIDDHGNILYAVSFAVEADGDPELRYFELPEGFVIDEYFVGGDRLLFRGACPSPHHRWENNAWQLDVAALDASVRAERDRLLGECDWTQLPDAPNKSRAAWAAYRQSLRDLPASAGWPLAVEWPVRPDGAK